MSHWITNVRDAVVNDDGSAHIVGSNGAKCVTCGKEMLRIWDTVCAKCGDTSCYDHSTIVGNQWRCEKCKDKE